MANSDADPQRLAQFQRWSSAGFPNRRIGEIRRINISNGLDPNESYGFRVFYHRYVRRMEQVEAELEAERRDT